MTLLLGKDTLTCATLVGCSAQKNPPIEVDPDALEKSARHHQMVLDVVNNDRTVYGINTGFGYLADVKIAKDKLQKLQVNLIRSHACGVGDYCADKVVRGLLVLRAHSFLQGHSGVSKKLLDTILACLRDDILPLIPEKGSVGASGDLAPLAHLALGLMGEGEVRVNGKRLAAAQALSEAGIAPIQPAPKEGLSLINGTHFMTVLAAHVVESSRLLLRSADVIAALSLDAVRGTKVAFDKRIQMVRGQQGQAEVAANLRHLFDCDDEIYSSHVDCKRVQDPYSFRCVPQVHGASRDTLNYVTGIVERELNAVTDNPLVFDNGDVISGGNFHGQPIALVMDFLAIAMAELGNISERRIEKITNPHLSGLPPFATKDSGINSGLMIPHVVAASLVSENKSLAHPASVDSIPTSANQEDHVSMGPIAARKAQQIVDNVATVLGIELLSAVQGISLLAPLKPGPHLQAVCEKVREMSPELDEDRSLHQDIAVVTDWIKTGKMLATLEDTGFHVQ